MAFAHYAFEDLLLETVGSNSSPSLHPWLQLRGHKKVGWHVKIPGFALGRFLIGLLLMQSPVLECSLLLLQMTSSGVMKGLFCLRGSSSGRWLDPIPGKQVLARSCPSPSRDALGRWHRAALPSESQ